MSQNWSRVQGRYAGQFDVVFKNCWLSSICWMKVFPHYWCRINNMYLLHNTWIRKAFYFNEPARWNAPLLIQMIYNYTFKNTMTWSCFYQKASTVFTLNLMIKTSCWSCNNSWVSRSSWAKKGITIYSNQMNWGITFDHIFNTTIEIMWCICIP
jgi:hypothetical protein